jgi:hypothetical protein
VGAQANLSRRKGAVAENTSTSSSEAK